MLDIPLRLPCRGHNIRRAEEGKQLNSGLTLLPTAVDSEADLGGRRHSRLTVSASYWAPEPGNTAAH